MNTWIFKTLIVTFYVCSCSFRHARGVVPAIFAFGDSLLDTGNNNYDIRSLSKANYYPYGMDFPNHAATGRFSNGKVPTDLIAEALGVKQTVPAYRKHDLQPNDLLTGVSFASGGSGLDSVTPKIQSVIWVGDQVKDFKEYIAKLNSITKDQNKTQAIISNAVFLICAGNNDIGITYFSVFRLMVHKDISKYTDHLITLTHTLLKDLYDMGARKFGVMGTLPLGCLPAHTNVRGRCYESKNKAALMFNEKLVKELNGLKANLSGARFVYIDMYNSVQDLIKNPKKSGFTTGKIPSCFSPMNLMMCSDASKHVFFDYVHPTERAFRVALAPAMDQLRKDFS